MRLLGVDLKELAVEVPTVPHDLSLKELRDVFDELGIYRYLAVTKNGTPIGIVHYRDVVKYINRDLTAGEIIKLGCKLRTMVVTREGLIGLVEMMPVHDRPIFVTDKRGSYLGILTYDNVLHHITKYKEKHIPVSRRVHTSFGKKEYVCIFGIKNADLFRKAFGSERCESLYKILFECVKDVFSKSEISRLFEQGEIWALVREQPRKEAVKELFREFHKEYMLLFGEFRKVYVYGYCIDMSLINSQDDFYRKKDELKGRAGKIEGSIFIIHGLQPTLVLHDPAKQKLITNIKKKIMQDFKEVVERLRGTSRDSWEYTLYDLFETYPYFELFYIMGGAGLQITNNIVNPKVDYFVAQGKKGTDRSKKPYFVKALKQGSFISDVYLSKATDEFCITVSEIFKHEGREYVLAGDINFREVHRLVKSYKEEAVD